MSPAVPQLSLLVVDDDRSCRDALVEFFRREGFLVGVASDGDEAFQILRNRMFHASVMDVHMPGRTGPEVLRTLSTDSDAPGVPPTVLVSSDEPAARDACRDLEFAVGFVPKPIHLQRLRSSLWQLLLRSWCPPTPGLPDPLRHANPPSDWLA